jgi:hypothetical protein
LLTTNSNESIAAISIIDKINDVPVNPLHTRIVYDTTNIKTNADTKMAFNILYLHLVKGFILLIYLEYIIQLILIKLQVYSKN